MLPLKEREDRGRSIRARILDYIKTGRTGDLERARDELVILLRLEGVVSDTDVALAAAQQARREVSGNWSRGTEEAELDALHHLVDVMSRS